MHRQFIDGFFATLKLLREYLPEIVIGGGWVPFLYYRYYVGDRLHMPVLTKDIDFMVKHRLPKTGLKTIDQILTDANLTAEFKTLDTPPIVHYEGKIGGAAVEIEFLTDQTGSNSEVVLEVQKGLHAEALRYVSIITENVLQLTLIDEDFLPAKSELVVQVPTPAAYIFQKGLAFTRRRDKTKAAKDMYYLFDILSGLPQLRSEIETDFGMFSKRHARWFQTFIRNLLNFFDSSDGEGSLYFLMGSGQDNLLKIILI